MNKLYSEIDAPITIYDAFGSTKTFKVEDHIVQCDEDDIELLLQLPYIKLVSRDEDSLIVESGDESEGVRGYKSKRGGAMR